jgi:hypothetical protein
MRVDAVRNCRNRLANETFAAVDNEVIMRGCAIGRVLQAP